jgi:hypothetical protein
MKKMFFGMGALVFVGSLMASTGAVACPCEDKKSAAATGTVKDEGKSCEGDKKSCADCAKCAKESGKACSCGKKTKES